MTKKDAFFFFQIRYILVATHLQTWKKTLIFNPIPEPSFTKFSLRPILRLKLDEIQWSNSSFKIFIFFKR